MPDKMGRAGGADAQYSSYRACTPGKFSPGYRVGRVYRCGDPGAEYPGPAYRVHPVGKSGAEEGPDAE